MLPRSTTLIIATISLMLGAGLAPATYVLSDDAPKAWTATGHSFELDVTVPGTPQEVFDAFTGDISPWWDHTIVKDPKALYIEPRPGGSFMEIFDDAGNGVQHARVIGADRGKFLGMVGPLGLAGSGLEMEMTFLFEASTDKTVVKFTCHLLGNCDAAAARSVQGVWKHFLLERFEPYISKHLH